jgi:NAD(P)-dependent dehydrogenase (short-subunit alcohol dehydrogenase family)
MDLGISGKWALVCAASKGLGKGCAAALVREGVNVVITARGDDALQATAKLASAKVTDLPPEKQAKQSARMAIFAVVSGCFDFHRTPKLTDRQSATKQIGEGVRGIVDHMTHKR